MLNPPSLILFMSIKKYPGGFGTQMGEYGDKNYPEFFPGMSVKIILPYYSKKNGDRDINIGEGIIMDSPVFDGNKPYLIKLIKYGINDYECYPGPYNGMVLDSNSYILVSRKNIID